MQLGRAEDGFKELISVLDRQPNHPLANLNIGKAYLEEGNLDFAENHLRSVIKSDPKSADGFLTLGIVLSKKGALDNAVAALRRALNMMPGDPDAQLNLANVLLAKGDEDEAISHYQHILDLYPEHVLARYHLGLKPRQMWPPGERFQAYSWNWARLMTPKPVPKAPLMPIRTRTKPF
jgi:tetratricopeptide (TPR) repeat protein